MTTLAGGSLWALAAYAAAQSAASVAPTITVVSAAGQNAASVPSSSAMGSTAAGPAANSAWWGLIGAPGTPMMFGVQTHFSQGWNPAWLGFANQVQAPALRDTVTWTSIERTPGVYEFSRAPASLANFCAQGGKLSLTIQPQNPIYDGGSSVYTDQGRAAYARYVAALLANYKGCITAIEVGNEINNSSGLVYPAGVSKASTYVALLQTLYATVKPQFADVSILGGSTNAIGTGFLETLFAAGALNYMDAVAVHPYRNDGEGIDGEIANLRQVMAKYGKVVPIWATEFSYNYADQRRNASGLIKSAVQLSASGVDRAFWYALVDQSSFPNMGLFTAKTMKPTGAAYAAVTQRVLSAGRAVRVDTGDNLVYLYRAGADRWVVWGSPRTITFSGNPVLRDMLGSGLGGNSVTIGADPILVEGASGYSLGASATVADTLLQYGSAPWSYWRRGKDGKDISLPIFDNDFTSYYGDRWSKPLRINNTTAAPAGDGANPMRAIMRYTAPMTGQFDLEACFTKTVSGDGVDYRIEKNGTLLASGVTTAKSEIHALLVNLNAGDRLDLSFGPNKTYGGDSFSYRAVLSQRGRGATLSCTS
ncbi:glycosyl hydrolase [Sphingomonas aracearum]|uniref:glycosyl hydrolase n=1 Tax=Sphingomonas aracearum TaxID=2283317 RepID=UPI0015EFDF1B|nr:glycosyl hydrolase [Sphingomonas aracearum]